MLKYSEIAQLSDKDLVDELRRSRDLLFRQQMGVGTAHLKDSHLVPSLRTHVARLLTEINRRRKAGMKVEQSDTAVIKKMTEDLATISKSQEGKKKKAKKQEEVDPEGHAAEPEEENAESDVKVKKFAKKGWLSRDKKQNR